MPYIAIGTNGDRTLYGVGESSDDAIHDAIINSDEGCDEDRFATMACTEALFAQVLDGDNAYVVRDHHAYTVAEAAAVDDGFDVDDEGVATDELELEMDDADRLGLNHEVEVTISPRRVLVSYMTVEGHARDIADEPGCPEAMARTYDHALRNSYAAVVGLLEQAVQRDAEAEATAA